ncbi:MAG TPA: hypothetical protein VEF90_02335, partial [Xanthobacteraceae bacterium]|nr:hypothetical protein [Xanthobacteraceae bacterium]
MPWRGGKRRSSMDILAAMLAYLVSVTAIVGALGVALFVFFAAPDRPTPPAPNAAMAARPSAMKTAAAAARPDSNSEKINRQTASGAAKPQANPVTTIAVDARQKPVMSPARLRRLAA